MEERGCGTGAEVGSSPVAAPLRHIRVTALSCLSVNAAPPLSDPQIPTSVHAGSKGTHGAPSLVITDGLDRCKIQTEGLPHAQHCPWVTA